MAEEKELKELNEKEINDCRSRLAIVLPSLDPDAKFSGVVSGLVSGGFEHIVIVDDGSCAEKQRFFEEAEAYPQCTVIHHGVNRGKGRGLKTAFSYILENLPDVEGALTIDGDGQHLLEDIVKCGDVMLENPGCVVLGCRDFDLPNVPPRSVAGNKFTSKMFRLLFGIRLSDTQTGLRAIPKKYLEKFCAISGERFEYETNMLLQMKRDGIDFIEQPIATVYDPDDYSSHYNAFKDSWKVGKVMLKFLVSGSGFRFILSSLTAELVDNGMYYALLCIFGMGRKRLFLILARIVSSFVNFNMNKYFAFRSRGNWLKEFWKYFALAFPQAVVTFFSVNWIQDALGVGVPWLATVIKIGVEFIIFIISYVVQKKWVFRSDGADDKENK